MNISTFVRSYMYEDLWSVETCLRADVSYIFPLLHAEKGRLCNAGANRVPASCRIFYFA